MKLQIFALAAALFLLLGGCGDKTAGQIIRYDIPAPVTSLDPQFATDAAARMVISNTFEGLFRQLPSGEIVPCIARSYDVSPDGLTYTFHLRQDARWSDYKPAVAAREARPATATASAVPAREASPEQQPSPVTAHDFAFAISRMFDSAAFSPFAGNFSSIRGAQLILNGTAPLSALGVRAVDDYTLEISLTRPDNLLPELLSSSYAMPCKQSFFVGTRARYGQDRETLLFNGPFYVRSWSRSGTISLRQNPYYVSGEPPVAAGVDLYVPEKSVSAAEDAAGTPLARFLDGTTDACKVTFDALPAVKEAGASFTAFEDTVWVLVLNQKLDFFANDNIRRAFSHAVDRNLFDSEFLPENLRAASVLIPPVVASLGHSYRVLAGEESPVAHDPGLARQYFTAGLDELGLTRLPLEDILVCTSDNQPLLTGYLQQSFQRALSLSAGLTALPKDEVTARVFSGDFQAAILPVSAAYSSPDAILGYFKSSSGQNFSGYHSAEFDSLLASIATLDSDARYAAYQQAENLLLSDCAAIPLYFETTYYATGKGVSDIAFSPFLSGVYFKDARKEG